MAKGLLKQGNTRLTKVEEPDPADSRTAEQIAAATVPAPRAEEPQPAESREEDASADALAIPEPYESDVELDAALSEQEERDLTTCELALDVLRVAFWKAGKALEVVLKGRLYRKTHRTFEGYVTERWDMKTSQAYRLIQSWRLAEAVSPIGDAVNEAQVRELLPIASRYNDQAAAVTVYATLVQEAKNQRVTAALIRQIAKALPEGPFDKDRVAQTIREHLTAPAAEDGSDDKAVTDWDVRFHSLRTTIRRFERPAFVSAARTDRDKALSDLTEAAKALQRVIEAVKADQ